MVCDEQIDQSDYRGWRSTSPIHGRHVQSQKSSFRNITLLTGYMRSHGFSRHTRYAIPAGMYANQIWATPYNKAKRWTVPFRNGCWQCWKGCWGSVTPRLYGVSCGSVDWNPYSSIGFAWQCGCTILWPNPIATQWKRSYMLTCSWVHDPTIAGQPYSFCHK